MAWFHPRVDPAPRPAPRWPDANGRPRVLVEHPDPLMRSGLRDVLTDADYDVLTCGGPQAADVPATSCPVLRQERCPAVADADVVISGLDLRDEVSRMILRRIARTDTRRPLVVTAPDRVVAKHARGLTEHNVFPVGARKIVAKVDELMAG